MKYDLTETGLNTVFKQYQLEAMRLLWENHESFSTREVWNHVNEKLEPCMKTISRASIINFLDAMENEKVLEYTETTGKGGHRRLYYSNIDEDGFRKELLSRLIDSANKNLLPINLN